MLDLVDLGLIDVQMRDAARVARELARITRDAIIEARTDRDQEIAVLDRVIGKCRAVHAEHAHRQRMRGVDGADAHERRHHGYAEGRGELGQCSGRAAIDDAAARVQQRPLRLRQQFEERGRFLVAENAGRQVVLPLPIARNGEGAFPTEHADGGLDVLRNIHHHGAGAARASDLERRAHGGFQACRVGDQEDMLGERAHHRGDGRLLEGVGTENL